MIGPFWIALAIVCLSSCDQNKDMLNFLEAIKSVCEFLSVATPSFESVEDITGNIFRLFYTNIENDATVFVCI